MNQLQEKNIFTQSREQVTRGNNEPGESGEEYRGWPSNSGLTIYFMSHTKIFSLSLSSHDVCEFIFLSLHITTKPSLCSVIVIDCASQSEPRETHWDTWWVWVYILKVSFTRLTINQLACDYFSSPHFAKWCNFSPKNKWLFNLQTTWKCKMFFYLGWEEDAFLSPPNICLTHEKHFLSDTLLNLHFICFSFSFSIFFSLSFTWLGV